MDSTTLETLEYPAVLKELAAYTLTPVGRQKAERLMPSKAVSFIEEAYREFSEVRDILEISGTLPLGGVLDIRPVLSRLDPEGAYLLQDDLLKIRNNLSAAIRLKSFLSQSFIKAYPKVSSRIEALSNQRALHSDLIRILDDKGQIKDGASPGLFRIRKEIRSGRDRARSYLEGLTKDKKFKECLQDDFITIRDDRYVLSIKTGMHAGLNGVIHGRSGSGATYFIEPFQIVEINNRIAIFKKEETAEEIEILKRATASVAEQREPLLSDLDLLGALDSVQAKALYAKDIGAIVPIVKKGGEVRLGSARHPLLAAQEARDSTAPKAVPIDIRLAEDCRVLVISGANTGGKTVALKTLGLLTLMVMASIPVPVEEGSEAVVFPSIFSDIGDRQDIIASLSTFSAHIKRIRGFLSLAGEGSLVLIDEIGAGTDPSEGCALALAALETFRENGAVTVVTTHLNLLKARAQTSPGYMNASVEFDESTLRPMYRLHYGVPGPSLGLSIAQSLGIPPEIIDKARANLKESEGAFIESVRMIEEERDELKKLKDRLASLEQKRNESVKRLMDERAAITGRARIKVESIVAKAKEEIREAVDKLREEGHKAVPPARKAYKAVDEAGSKVLERMKFKPETGYMPSEGDRVGIKGSNTRAVVLKVDREAKKVELQAGGIKAWAPWDKLTKIGGNDKKVAVQAPHINADMEVASSINIIGMRVHDAMPLVVKFLDNAHANGLNAVEVIHGVGTGRLSKAVEENLRSNRYVKRFCHADQSRGGAGVTVVEFL